MAEDSKVTVDPAEIERCKHHIKDALTLIERVEHSLEAEDANREVLRLAREFLWSNVNFLGAAYALEAAQLHVELAEMQAELERLRTPGNSESTIHFLNG